MDEALAQKELVFSCLSGYGFYRITENVKDIFGRDKVRAYHFLNGTEVEIRYDDSLKVGEAKKKWRYFIENPMDIKNILWPVDMVDADSGRYGLVFRRRAFPSMSSLRKLLYNDKVLDWRNPNIQKLIVNLLELFNSIHSAGYVYHSFDMRQMYYDENTMSLLFDFSLAMTRKSNDMYKGETVRFDDVGIEFLPVWADMNKDNKMSMLDEYYSIAALLFRLMIGRMPYQGRLMDGKGEIMNELTDNDERTHVIMFEEYRKNPVFIFDPNDNRNEIGLYDIEQKFVERWNYLPISIRAMFIQVFSYDNMNKEANQRVSYSPERWLEVLTQKCFIQERG